jgi:hypothetical protein
MSWLIVMCGLVAACGEHERGDYVSLDYLDSEFAKSICAKAAECCFGDDFIHDTGVDSEEACLANLTQPGGLARAYRDSTEKGRSVYHGDAVAACLDAVDAATCEAYATRQVFATCDPWIDPLVDEGGQCVTTAECRTGYCAGGRLNTADGVLEYGTCQPVPTLGESCPYSRCTAGLWCGSDIVCIEKSVDGADCFGDRECMSGFCNGVMIGSDAPGTCGDVMACLGA